ncbi:hypothetical protein T439DRAFT_321861 [Meredithblackwellia eburnea MCA 4105]
MFVDLARQGITFDPSRYPALLIFEGRGVSRVVSEDKQLPLNSEDCSHDRSTTSDSSLSYGSGSNSNSDSSSPFAAQGRQTLYIRSLAGRVGDHLRWSRALSEACPGAAGREYEFRNLVKDMEPEMTIRRFYAGQSSQTDGLGRHEADIENGEDGFSWFKQFLTVNQLGDQIDHYTLKLEGCQWRLFETPKRHSYEARGRRGLHEGERLLVAVLGRASLNSALGGFHRPFQPPPHLITLAQKTKSFIATLSPTAVPVLSANRPPQTQPSRREDIVHKVREHFKSMVQYFNNRNDVGQLPKPASLERIIGLTIPFDLSTDGYPTHIRLEKDVPKEEFDFEETGVEFYGPLSGGSGHSHRTIAVWSGLHDLDLLDSLPWSEEVIRRVYGAFINFWCIILVHEDVIVAIIFLLRYLLIVEAGCCVVASSKLYRLMSSGLIRSAIGKDFSIKSPFFVDVGSADPESVRSSLCVDIVWHDLPKPGFIKDQVGTTEVVELVQGLWMVQLYQVDFGLFAYDPQFDHLLRRLAFVVELKAKVLASVVSLARPVTTNPDGLISVRDHCEKICSQQGINAAIESAKSDYLQLSEVLHGLRTLSARAPSDPSVTSSRLSSAAIRRNDDHLKASGEPFSDERRTQAEVLTNRHKDLLSRGNSTKLAVPSPKSTTPGEPAWTSWFLALQEGTDVVQSAFATGHNPMANIKTPQQLELYRKTRQSLNSHLKKEFPAAKDVPEAMTHLENPRQPRLRHHDAIFDSLHPKCGHRCLSSQNTGHRCSAADQIIKVDDSTCDRTQLLYPFQVQNLSSDPLPTGWALERAEAILARHPNRLSSTIPIPSTSLLPIVFRGTTNLATGRVIPSIDWHPSPSSSEAKVAHEQWLLHQAEASLLLAVVSPAMEGVNLVDPAWRDSKRVAIVHDTVHSALSSTTTRSIRYATCAGFEKTFCGNTVFGSKSKGVKHGYHPGVDKKVSSGSTFTLERGRFSHFTELPLPLALAVHYSTWEGGEKSHGRSSWEKEGKPCPWLW